MASSGYTIGLIRHLLANYGLLEQGQLPSAPSSYVDLPIRGRQYAHKAPFEMASLLKCDIDRAIQKLPPQQKFIVMVVDIDERELGDCAYWLGKDSKEVGALEVHSIEQMSRYLNGKQMSGKRKDYENRHTCNRSK